MADPVVCSQCGARNSAAAAWCGQCYAPLGDQIEDAAASDPAADPVAPPNSAPETVAAPASPTVGEKPDGGATPRSDTWVCSVCEVANSLAVEECAACGTSIFRSFGAVEEERVMVDPQQALFRSVMFPGLGHAYAKQGLLGSAIGGLALMSLGFGIGLVATGVGSFGWPLLLEAVGVWVAAAFDAYRLGEGQEVKNLLLRPRVITALVGSVIVTVILAATLRGQV